MSDVDFDQLMRRLRKKARTAPQMVQAMVELTYGCNLRCVHCYNPTHEATNELTREQVLRTLDGLATQGCLWVGFTGGELFTRRDALEIIRYAKQLGLVVNILTNATMITPALADQIQLLDPYLMEVSVYGATPTTYEKVTQVPGSFAKFVRGLDLLIERRVPVLLKLIMLTLNVHEHEAMREFALARGVRYQASTEIHAKVDGSLEPLRYRLSPQQAFEIWRKESGDKLRQREKGSRVRSDEPRPIPLQEDQCSSAGRLFDCRCGKTSAAVTPYGKLNLCLSIYYPQYDLAEGSFAEGWRHLVDLVAQAEAGPAYECPRCPLTQRCTRGTLDSWLEQGIFDSACIPYFKELAELKAQYLENGHRR